MKKTVTKVLLVIIPVVGVISVILFHDWYERQYNKLLGFYYVYKGDKEYKKLNYHNAIDYYIKGLNYYPSHTKARCNLGNLYVVYENYFEAAQTYEEALKYNPKYMSCRMDYGIILSERLGEYDKAIEEYEKIINTHPFLIHIPFIYNNLKSVKINRGLAYYNMGIAYRNKSIYTGDNKMESLEYLKKARESYGKAKKLIPRDYDTFYNSALTNQLLSDIKGAGLDYCRAIELKPYNFEAHYNYALLLRSLKFYKESLEELEKAGILADQEANALQLRYIYETLGEVKQRLINDGETDFIKSRVEVSANNNSELAYRNGKVILKEAADNFLTKRLKNCPKKEYFEEL